MNQLSHFHSKRSVTVAVLALLTALGPMQTLTFAANSTDIAALQRRCEQADAKVTALTQQLQKKPPVLTTHQQLRDAIDHAFEQRQSLHAAQLEQARANHDEAIALWDERQAMQKQIVDRRLEQIINRELPASAPEKSDPNQVAELQKSEADLALESPKSNSGYGTASSMLEIQFETAPSSVVRDINRLLRTNYRGALQIVDVWGMSHAETHGLRQRDVLIGIGSWQTTQESDAMSALSLALEKDNDKIPFYIVRFELENSAARRDGTGMGPDMGMENGMDMGMDGGMGGGMDMGMGMGMGMDMGSTRPQVYRGEFDRKKLLAKRNEWIEQDIAVLDEAIQKREQMKKATLAEDVDSKIMLEDLPSQEDDSAIREMVTQRTLAEATREEFRELVEDSSIEQPEFLARLSELLQDDTARELTSSRADVAKNQGAIFEQRVSGLDRKVKALRDDTTKRFQDRLQELRDAAKKRNQTIVEEHEEAIADFQKQRESLEKRITP